MRRSFLAAVVCLGTLASFAASDWGLLHSLKGPDYCAWVIIAICPALGLLLGSLSLRLLSQSGRIARLAFVLPTLIGATLLALLLEGQFEHALHDTFNPPRFMSKEEFQRGLWIITAIPCLVGLGLLIHWKRRPKSPVRPAGVGLGDWVLAAGIVVVLGAVGLLGLNRYALKIQNEGLKHWVEIGRPMEEFSKHQTPIMENASLHALLADLHPYGITNLYKAYTLKNSGGDANSSDSFTIPQESLDLLNYGFAPTDSVTIPPEKTAPLAARAGELLVFYQRILSRPAPVWESDPHDSFEIAVPNFLLLRKMAQTMKADALVRLSRGDREGTAAAVNACDRVSASLRENPTMVSLMIRVAIDGLLASANARLPYEENGFAQLEKEAREYRTRFDDLMQMEAWMLNAHAEGTLKNSKEMGDEIFRSFEPSNSPIGLASLDNLPHWFRRAFLVRPFLQIASGWTSNFLTGMIACWDHQDLLTCGDCGDELAGRLISENSLFLMPSFVLAITRIRGTLLVREQSQMIRLIRTQMAKGNLGPQSEHASGVIPGAKWEVAADSTARTASLKLTPIPPWVTKAGRDGTIDEKNFLLLPLDGSKSWKFDLP